MCLEKRKFVRSRPQIFSYRFTKSEIEICTSTAKKRQEEYLLHGILVFGLQEADSSQNHQDDMILYRI